MAVDVISSLNTNGSGLNITQLAKDLTQAETSAKRSIVTDRIDKAEVSLSALDRLRTQFESLDSAVGAAASASATSITSDNSAIVLTSEDTENLVMGDTTIAVEQMAQQQVLAFGGFSGETDTLAGGTLVIDFGSWDDAEPSAFTADATKTQQTITIAEGTTLAELADQITALDGLAASIIDVGDGTFSLGVLTDYGAKNAVRFTATQDDPASTNTAIDVLDMTDQVEDVQMQAAMNAQLKVNGITITRPSNDIDDVIPGVSFTVAGYSDYMATVSVEINTTAAEEAMQGLVDAFNTTLKMLDTMTDRGYAGSAAGDLAGDSAINGLRREFERSLNQGISGYGDRTYYLSDLGVRTERDGTLTLDTNALEDAMTNSPQIFEAILRDGLSSPTAGVELSGTPGTTAIAGRYSLTRDTVTGTAFVNGIELVNEGTEDGITTYTATSGNLRGVSFKLEDGVENAIIDFGRSFISNFQDSMDKWLSSSGAMSRRENSIGDSISDDSTMLDSIDASAEAKEAYYLTRFTQMEMVVTTLNNTGDYLESLIDAWNNSNN
ncbi:flagellar filament capping protein FliD [Donghicola tyrosinivorans]|uniref:Flagellar hook-associated protein 2 n=1 Tax=Donghicola tyrosinivorans TaxID=1652492 RepID=A0A2T0WIH0_9RHOB|nr:flagellar filament capping protein FliD [Donghicola tyrosinivorans]PRY86486.1 flagellar hook-associated protein 2 [Donghicola tyrosinivorans]